MTLRRALAGLEAEGLIRREAGRGTWPTVDLPGVQADIRRFYLGSSVTVLEAGPAPVPAFAARLLGVADGCVRRRGKSTPEEPHRLDVTAVQLRWRPSGIPLRGHSHHCPRWPPEPPDDPNQLAPSTWPGSRLPHAWLADGRSTLDLLGRDFTLIGVSVTPEAPRPLAAMRAAGPPVSVQRCDDGVPGGSGLLLVRPDGHVGWRGASDPPDADRIVTTLSGRCGSASEGSLTWRSSTHRAACSAC